MRLFYLVHNSLGELDVLLIWAKNYADAASEAFDIIYGGNVTKFGDRMDQLITEIQEVHPDKEPPTAITLFHDGDVDR